VGRLEARPRQVEVGGRRFEVRILEPEPPWAELARRHAERERAGGAASDETVVSPMQGTVLKLEVAEGDAVESGQVVAVVEAMKMENEITAHRSGRVSELGVAPGEPVSAGQAICVISD
jgi:acetyl-CoA/propionyl-CoA carboxylase biotin carboxyl carrier protein